MANVDKMHKNGLEEALNTLRGNLMLRYPDAKAICLTGERPYADKLPVTFGLARRFAAMGKRTLFVECAALERPVAEDWQKAGGPTLSDCLAGRAEAADIIRRVSESLDAIPSGAAAQISEYISGNRLGALLDGLRADYDVIIVDATALATCADAALVAARCDGALLLAEYRRTQGPEAQRVKTDLERDGIKLLGTVLVAPEKIKGRLTEILTGLFRDGKN